MASLGAPFTGYGDDIIQFTPDLEGSKFSVSGAIVQRVTWQSGRCRLT